MQKFSFSFSILRYGPFGFNPENFANNWQIEWNWTRSMKFETVQIHFLSDVFGLLSSRILPWQHDVMTSPLVILISQYSLHTHIVFFIIIILFIFFFAQRVSTWLFLMQFIRVFIWHNVTVRWGCHVSPQMTCSSLEFLVVQWLEHPTSVWMVKGSIPIWNSEFFLSSSLHIYHFIYNTIFILEILQTDCKKWANLLNKGALLYKSEELRCINPLAPGPLKTITSLQPLMTSSVLTVKDNESESFQVKGQILHTTKSLWKIYLHKDYGKKMGQCDVLEQFLQSQQAIKEHK